MRTWRAVLRGHNYVSAYPMVLLPLVFAYLVVTLGIIMLCSGIGWLLPFLFSTSVLTTYTAVKTLFVVLESALWLHYLLLALLCFRSAVRLQMTVLGVAQLVIVTVLIFAASHYYVALLSDTRAYHSVTLPIPEGGWTDSADLITRLSYQPSLETIIDFIYFSMVTTATVGYGDIYPMTSTAKIVTVAHIATSIFLISGVLSMVIGQNKSLADQGK